MTEDYRIITAPVIIPDKPDCDYDKGEPPLTQTQIRQLKESYDNYQLIDYDHQLAIPGNDWYLRIVGTPQKSWITETPTTYTNIHGKTETIPAGTWWLTSKVTDPEIVSMIDDKLITAYSITVGNKGFCDDFIRQLQLAPKNNTNFISVDVSELVALKHKTLIKDIVDPVGFSVSLTGIPCIGSATFSRACYEQSKKNTAEKNDKGGNNMTEENNENRFSISELLGIKELFANKKDETPNEEEGGAKDEAPSKEPEQEKEFVTQEEFKEAITATNNKISDIEGKVDKILEKLEPEKEEEEEEEEEEEKAPTANKNDAPVPESSQLDNTDDGNNLNDTANKNDTDKKKIMGALNRKGNGEFKFPRAY